MPKKKTKNCAPSQDTPVISFNGETKVRILDYDSSQFQEKEVKRIEECFSFKDTKTVSWIDVKGINQTEVIKQLDDSFGLHPLVLEDIKNLEQRPRMEDFGNYIYISLKILNYQEEVQNIESEQISIILGKNFVITFQQGKDGDIFETIRDRIRNNKGKIRKMGTDYLVYRIINEVVDSYFYILEKIGEKVEGLGEEVMSNPSPETLHLIHNIKRETLQIRKAVWPLREILNNLERGESSLVKKSTCIYLRDAYNHTIQIVDNIETTRDMLSEMMDIYLSSINNKINEVMKVLTIIATIFMPLTFFAGVYGMNFKHFPEISWQYGYPLFWLIVAITVVSMLIYFKRKKWL
jgi:magnesium transporter